MDLFRKLKLKYPCIDNKELFDHDYVVKHEDDTTHNTYMDSFDKSYLKIRSASDIKAAYAILTLCNSEPLDLSFSSSFVSFIIRLFINLLPIFTSYLR